MRRRGFLRGIGVAGLTWGLAVPARAARIDGAAPRRASLADRLAAWGANLGVSVTRFDGSHPIGAGTAAMPASRSKTSGKLQIEGATVHWQARLTEARDRRDALDVETEFRILRGRLPNARVAVTLTVGGWTRDAYVMVPGAVYAGNRFASRHIPFPPLTTEPSDIGPHVPPIVSDIPRLNNQAGDSHFVLTAVDTAVPCIGARVGAAADGSTPDRGLVVLSEPTTALGLVDLEAVENADRSVAVLSVGTPGVRPDVRYGLCNSRVPSADRGADLEEGCTATLRLRVLIFACADVQTLFDRWYEARRDRVGAVRLRHEVPLSVARQAVQGRILADQWTEGLGIFSTRSPTIVAPADLADTAPSPQLESIFRTGADGGLALSLPLLQAGGADARRRAVAALDFQLGGQAPSGLFHAATSGAAWWDEGESPPPPEAAPAGGAPTARTTHGAARGADPRAGRGRHWTHVGRNAEALYLACKQVLFMQRTESGFRAPDRWRTGLARSADALVKLWTRHQQLGQYASCDTGDVVVGGSCAGALVPAALIHAGRVLETDSYKTCAVATAEAFYSRFVRAGLTLGGAPAALQSPDSRSAAALLESFVTLAEATADGDWFSRAAEVAHQLATWVIAWNVSFPAASTMGKLAVATTGAVLASAQDKWALPGFAGLSGDALFRLYRATGRASYLELLRETVHNSSAYVDLEDRRPELETKAGWVAGRIPVGDALGAAGEVPAGTPAGAAQASCLMAATDVPSVYVQPDTGFVFAFDHVDARLKQRSPAGLIVTIHNPTRFEADLRLFSENDTDRARPLELFPLLGARALTLDAGATENVEIARAPPT